MIWDLLDTVNELVLLGGIVYCTAEICRYLAARHKEN